MCNAVAPVESPVDKDIDLEKTHIAREFGPIGRWTYTMCGLRRQVISDWNPELDYCIECLARMSSYGYRINR